MAAKWALDPRSAMDVDDEQPRASTRLSAGKPRRLNARSEASADDARDRVAREAAVAARHTVWTPAHEQALLAALASTPEYAEGRRLPDSRWLEIGQRLAEPDWMPNGVLACTP
jgi:hypothetical protein